METYRTRLLNSGVKSLKEFGYPDVTPENIVTDFIYAKFFLSILEDERPKLARRGSAVLLACVDQLIDECKAVEFKDSDERFQ